MWSHLTSNAVPFKVYDRLLLKNTFNNKKVNILIGELYKRVSLKEAVKAWLAAAVAVEAFA